MRLISTHSFLIGLLSAIHLKPPSSNMNCQKVKLEMEHHPDNSENKSPSEKTTNGKPSNNDEASETQLAKFEADLADLSKDNPKVANVIRGLASTFRISHVEEHFSGPLPHPAILAQYEEILPGSADRIVTSAESQMNHRQSLEKAVITANNRRETSALVIAGILALVISVGSLALIFTGKSVEGLSTIIVETVILAGVFLRAQKSGQEERINRQREITKARGGLELND